jgi:precorrin-6B methylase 2
MQVFANPRANSCGGRERIIAVRDTFCAHVRKMEHMKAAALSAERLEYLVRLIEESGYAVTEIAQLAYRHEKNIGTTLVAAPAKPRSGLD